MKLVSIKPATDGKHKFTAVFDNDGRTKTTHFGAKGYDDFTIKGDTEQRDRYRKRHEKDLKTNDPTKAGFLSYYILWNKPTVTASIADYKKRFNL
jgi:ABC-type sulfate transport system substrate-binding protein